MFYLSLFLYIFFVAVTMAEVKKETGEFKLKHTDSVFHIPIQRIYSSRSLFKGYFGFNWCSPLDMKLVINPNELILYDCDVGKYLTFKKTSDTEYTDRQQLGRINATKYIYHYATKDSDYFFSIDGRLDHWKPKGKPTIYLIYKDGQIWQMLAEQQAPQTISLSHTGQIIKIGSAWSYQYGQGVLKNVLRNRKTVWRYEYDEFLNMTLWRGVSQQELMRYDSEWDRIIYIKDKFNCHFRFKYELKEAKKYIIESQKCLNSAEQATLFEVLSPQLLIKSPTDTLGKEFRSAERLNGGPHVETF